MLAIDVVINLAKIMLILNGLRVTFSQADATAFNTNSSFSLTASTQHELKTMPREILQNEGVSVNDFLNIRHERSKQRRYAVITEEQQPQAHLNRNLYEIKSETKSTDKRMDDIKGHIVVDEQQKSLSYPTNEINAPLKSATNIYALNNVTSNLNNAIEMEVVGNNSRTILLKADNTSIYETSELNLHLTSFLNPEPTTTLKAVTHRIRKLHKKKIVESLRQLSIDKFQTNGGHLTKNHHRSLLEAEQHLEQQQQEQQQQVRQAQLTDINKFFHTTSSSIQQTTRIDIHPDAKSSHQMAKESNRNKAKTALNDIDTNEFLNVGDLTNIMMARDEKEENSNSGEDDDDDDGKSNNDKDVANQDNDDSFSDDFYQNDDNNSSKGNNQNVDNNEDDDDLLFGSTVNSLLDDDKFEQPFKNFSSIYIKDVDNSVDLEENENETLVISWQDIKDMPVKSLNFTNTTKSNTNFMKNFSQEYFSNINISSSTEFPYDLLFSSEDHSSQDSINNHPPHSSLYEKEEIIFSESADLAQNENSPSHQNIIMDEALKGDDQVDDNSVQFNDFPLANSDETEIDESETEVTSELTSDDDTNHFLEGVVDAANSEEVYDWDEISRSNRRDLMHGRDVVTKFLQIVETQHSLGSNCEAGTSLNLGEGVVDRYAQDRFRVEAEVAVNRANMLTRIFKMTSAAAQADVNLLHASVLSMVEFDDDIFAAGNCFDWNEHPAQPGLFCPFAYRLPPPNLGAILAKDLAMEYHYLGNTSEWFFQARKNAEKVIARNEQYLKAFHLYSNKTDERIEDDTLAVKYEDGRWSKPYYDCGGGNIWMLTYTVPFFGYENSTYHFKIRSHFALVKDGNVFGLIGCD